MVGMDGINLSLSDRFDDVDCGGIGVCCVRWLFPVEVDAAPAVFCEPDVEKA